jgi:serine/threonine protein kinase
VAVSSNTSGPPGGERRLIDAALRDAEQLAQMDAAFAPPPDSFTGYTILREVHRGGQGVVYRAVQNSTSRGVAIKVLREGPFASEADRARFDREVQILGQLNHPGIVAIHDTGVAAGHQFLVMDYISGQPLDVHMASGERSVDETLRLFATICEAVNAAHLRGIIHRDLKPSNVQVDAEGVPHVLDFGLARVALSGRGDGRP